MMPADTLRDPAAYLADKTIKTLAGGFAPAVEFSLEGQKLVGEYQGYQEFIPPNTKTGKKVRSHRLKLIGLSDGIRLMRQENEIEPTAGLIVSLTGSVLDTALDEITAGMCVVITYDGLGRKKKGQNQAKLFTIGVIS